MRGLRKLCDDRGLVFIDDAGESLAGTVGHIGCFSFFGNSPLAIGQAGALTTDDDAFAAKARSLRSHAMTSVTWDRHRGHADSYDVVDIGFNYRIDEMRAALGLSRLSRLKPRD
jgi:dTDP-4-amino-4,6-dideoxygalactose transaminase